MLLLWIQIADAMYPPWYLVQIMIALAHIIPKAKLVTHRDIAEFGFKDLVKRKRVGDLIHLAELILFFMVFGFVSVGYIFTLMSNQSACCTTSKSRALSCLLLCLTYISIN
jgi:hypothetical protein